MFLVFLLVKVPLVGGRRGLVVPALLLHDAHEFQPGVVGRVAAHAAALPHRHVGETRPTRTTLTSRATYPPLLAPV